MGLMIHDRMGEMRNEYSILVGERGQRLLGILEYTWNNNIKRVLNRV
jgi:hypothetical protein